MHSGKFQEGQIQIQVGQPHINRGKANCLGRGANQFQGGAKAPLGPLLNRTHTHSTYIALIGVHKMHGRVHPN